MHTEKALFVCLRKKRRRGHVHSYVEVKSHLRCNRLALGPFESLLLGTPFFAVRDRAVRCYDKAGVEEVDDSNTERSV